MSLNQGTRVYQRTIDSLQGRLDQMPAIKEDHRQRMIDCGRDGDVWDDPVFKSLQTEMMALTVEENEIRRKKSQMEPLTKAEIGDNPQNAVIGTEVEVLFHPIEFDDREVFIIGGYDDQRVDSTPRVISTDSPLGKALLGLSVNAVKSFKPSVDSPGQTTFTLLDIKPARYLIEP
jgi:transcription elongation GreA/GreB family factor